MNYRVCEFFSSDEIERSWLISILSDYDFDSFEETEASLKAYIASDKFDEVKLREILLDNELNNISYKSYELEDKNWNEEWEKNFEPLTIGGKVGIRAPFHQPLNTEIELIIEPKMSFGTGHHATTASMVELMLKTDLENKTVLDIGSGTGILSILAEKLKAVKITAIDNEEWAYKNCLENIERNNCVKIESLFGNGNALADAKFDLILANINRLVIIENLEKWVGWLNENGKLLISGILLNDENDLLALANKLPLKLSDRITDNGWLALSFIRT